MAESNQTDLYSTRQTLDSEILYPLLTGRLPTPDPTIHEGTSAQILGRHQTVEGAFPRALPDSCSTLGVFGRDGLLDIPPKVQVTSKRL